MELTEVTDRLREDDLSELLAASVGLPSPAKLEEISALYARDGELKAYATFTSAGALGLAGPAIQQGGSATLRHLAVLPALRRRGLGRSLVLELLSRLGLSELRAETDQESRGVYSACGFQVASLGELHPGVERFACVRRAA